MEKIEITLTLDSEKMSALTFYLGKENSTVQKKMDEALRQLYEEAVPEAVREYLDARTAPAKPKRSPRPSRAKTDTLSPQAAPATENHGEGSV